MKEDETILYEFATQLYRDKNVSDATFDAAVANLGERSVMDLIGILGYYDFVSMTLIAAKAEPPQDAVPTNSRPAVQWWWRWAKRKCYFMDGRRLARPSAGGR